MLVISCDPAQLPPLYADVVDADEKPVGRLVEIFGNISSPCASVYCGDTAGCAPDGMLYTK
ncbi:MAG: RNA-binding protein [Methanomicrobium sp.]|nr:RNA-binding protein [Methanomicrobium sp.]MBO4522836.1 RNA-binding protein [Methanomicrobium sp.]MBR6011943.1 RNA-binding protein [Methanomicrobium sp.]MBR6447191.1 RNA-binding protein [Methanomicrobium sp.]MBR6498010.1 RNA-binding protein [Methanomicrobium sp.]